MARIRIAVLSVEVGRFRQRIRVLDLIARRHGELPVELVDDAVAGGEGEKIRACATHDRLVKVVAERVVFCQFLEEWRIARGHVEEAHELATLPRMLRRDAGGVAALPGGGGNPGVRTEALVVASGLLPHLEETMHRVTRCRGGIGVGNELSDLERSVTVNVGMPVTRKSACRSINGLLTASTH
jgi:hypothetical protein